MTRQNQEMEISTDEMNPDLTLILYQARMKSQTLYGNCSASELLPEIPFADVKNAMRDSVDNLTAGYYGDEQNVILTLCRMIMTCRTKNIDSKDVAGEKVLKDIPEAHKKWVKAAVQSYRGEKNIERVEEEVFSTIEYLKNSVSRCMI